MTFTLLIYTSGEANGLPDSVIKSTLKQHQALQRTLGNKLKATAQLGDPNAAKTIRIDGERMPALDGPFMEAKEWLVGFYLVECDTEDEALAYGRQICSPHHAIEVRPAFWHKIP